MTRAKHALSNAEGTQSPPSTNKIRNSKLEIRNSKQFQMIKNQKVPNEPVLDFAIRISDLSYGLNDLNDLNSWNGSNQGSVSWQKT
jgi:hypothetical protein